MRRVGTKMVKRRFFLGSALCALVVGCGGDGKKKRVEVVRWGDATPERRAAFAEALRTALKAHDDLYDKRIEVRIEAGADGKPRMSVHAEALEAKGIAEKAVAVSVTNFSLNHPGIGYQEIAEGAWWILLPDDMPIEAEGSFELKTFEST